MNGREERPITSLLSELTHETTTLFRKEVQLAKAELSQKVSQAASGAGMAVAGGLILFVGIQVLVATAVIALALVVDWWLAALIVALVVLAIGGVVLMKGVGNLKADRLTPQRTITSLRDNAHWARGQMR